MQRDKIIQIVSAPNNMFLETCYEDEIIAKEKIILICLWSDGEISYGFIDDETKSLDFIFDSDINPSSDFKIILD